MISVKRERWVLAGVVSAAVMLSGLVACDVTGPPVDMTVEGEVLDEAGAPIAGALVRVTIELDASGGELASTQSDSTGAFELSFRRPDEGTAYLVATAAGYQTVGANLSQITGGHAFLTVTLPPAE